MSLLLISTATSMVGNGEGAALAEAGRQGFDSAVRLDWPGGRAHWFPTPANPRGSGACVSRGAGCFAAYVGTVHWGRLSGKALLEALLDRAAPPHALPLDEFAGSFVMLLAPGDGKVWLFNDALGIHKHYETDDGQLRSTSFMVCRSTLVHPRVDRMRAQEYVLLGANHGPQTPIEGVRTADPCVARELVHDILHPMYPASGWRAECPYSTFEDAVQGLAQSVAGLFADMVAAFGQDIGMALSGGMDSRLLLAALDQTGHRPSLYVYGADEDPDVRVARVVAASIGLPIECMDKRRLNSGATEGPPLQRLAANLCFFDGLPPDGALDAGADRHTRLLQVQGGRLNLNGGGGEILRNFFYLRDRPFTPAELALAFYSNWPRSVMPDANAARQLQQATGEGIACCLGLTPDSVDQPLPRSDVELVYTLFRLRWWMGRNNSLAGRYGAFLTPFVQPKLVRLAASLPLAWKDFGRLECALIKALSPRVAAGPSAYGFSFAQGPGLGHRLRVLATALRPVQLRAQSANIRRALGRHAPVALPEAWHTMLRQLPEQDWLRADALTQLDEWNRLLTLQAVAGPHLAPATAAAQIVTALPA